jgi:hypothetical protein
LRNAKNADALALEKMLLGQICHARAKFCLKYLRRPVVIRCLGPQGAGVVSGSEQSGRRATGAAIAGVCRTWRTSGSTFFARQRRFVGAAVVSVSKVESGR